MAEMIKALKLEQVAILKTYIDNEDVAKLAEAKGYTDTKVGEAAADTTALAGKVATLIGDDTNKSVRTIANEELAAQLIPEGAKEALDTLQEIAAWIQQHPDDAAAMNAAIASLEGLVGTIPEGATATNVVAYISEVVDAAVAGINAEVAKKADKLSADAISANQILVDDGTGNLKGSGKTLAGVASDIATAKSEAIDSAAEDATSKANTAKADAIATAAEDATTKANAAKSEAIAAVQGETTETVKSVDDKVTTINATLATMGYATDDEVKAALGLE